MPRASATQHELARIELLAGLPGETLLKLSKRMEREEIAPGTPVVREDEPGDRFYDLFAGMLSVSWKTMARRAMLRPGDHLGEGSLARVLPRIPTLTAIPPAAR